MSGGEWSFYFECVSRRIIRIHLSNFYICYALWHIPAQGMVIPMPVRAKSSAKGKLVKETVEHKKKVKKVKTARSANAIPMSKHTNLGQASRAFICFQSCFHPLSIDRAKTADDVGDLHSPVASLEPETPVEDQISTNFQSFRPLKNCKQLIPLILSLVMD